MLSRVTCKTLNLAKRVKGFADTRLEQNTYQEKNETKEHPSYDGVGKKLIAIGVLLVHIRHR